MGLELRDNSFIHYQADGVMPSLPPPGSCPACLISSVVSPDSHLLEDTVQCFWPADVKADEHSIRVWVGQRPDIVIVRGTWRKRESKRMRQSEWAAGWEGNQGLK